MALATQLMEVYTMVYWRIQRHEIWMFRATHDLGLLLLELISGRPPYCKDRGCIVNWAMEYLQHPDKLSMLVDPELRNVKSEDLSVICSVINLCIDPEPSKRPSMQIPCAMLENGIGISVSAILNESSLAWTDLALSV